MTDPRSQSDDELVAADVTPAELDELDDDAYVEAGARRRRRLGVVAIVVIVALVAATVAFSIGRISGVGVTAPTTTSAEAGFARDMQTHHDQGVEMSMIVRDLTDDEPVRLLAYDIATTQGAQSGMMAGWMQLWGLPAYSPEESMTWMTRPGLDGTGHDHTGEADPAHVPGEPMPGLATAEQMRGLQSESGVEAERTFLTLMIAHHRGAIDMADAVLDRSQHPTVTNFARGVANSQQSEIDLMEDMLAERE